MDADANDDEDGEGGDHEDRNPDNQDEVFLLLSYLIPMLLRFFLRRFIVITIVFVTIVVSMGFSIKVLWLPRIKNRAHV